MSVRAKFICIENAEYGDSGAFIKMQPVYSGSEENQKFFKATPCGQIELGIVNSEAAKQIEQGKEYYIDISPAE